MYANSELLLKDGPVKVNADNYYFRSLFFSVNFKNQNKHDKDEAWAFCT